MGTTGRNQRCSDRYMGTRSHPHKKKGNRNTLASATSAVVCLVPCNAHESVKNYSHQSHPGSALVQRFEQQYSWTHSIHGGFDHTICGRERREKTSQGSRKGTF
eukprot:PhF_6_TR25094/c0_g1_i1/m.34467